MIYKVVFGTASNIGQLHSVHYIYFDDSNTKYVTIGAFFKCFQKCTVNVGGFSG